MCGAAALYVVVANLIAWLEIAHSAFFGIRAPAEPILGTVAILVAVGPTMLGLVLWRVRRRQGVAATRAFTVAAVVSGVVGLLALGGGLGPL